MSLHAPVLVMKDSMKRESGTKVHQANIQAAKAVADIIRTTLGPRSMLKMLLDASGGIVVTNDGNAILREIDIAHPAAKSMIELSRTQDEEVGDGTTSVIVLAGEMLHVAQAFIDKNYHPTVICRAYTKALDDAIAVLDKIAMPVDVNDREAMLGLVKSSIGTKFTGQFGDLIADLAIDATTTAGVDLGQGMREVDIKKYIKVEKVPGGQLEDSRVLKGVMFNKDVVAPGKMRRKIVNPRIILLDCPVEYKKGENQTNAELMKEEDWQVLLEMEEEYIKNLCAQILKFKPDLVITEKGLSDLAIHYLSKAGVSAIRRLRKTDNNRIAKACGAVIVNRPEELQESDVGTRAGLFEVKKIGDDDRSPVDQHILALPAMDEMNPTEQNTSTAQTAPDISRKFDQEASYQELTRMIVLHAYPLSIVEHEEMRRFAKSLNPAFNMASSIDIEEYSTLWFQKEKADLKKKIALLPHRVSLSASVWAPHGAEASVKYLSLAVHFIDSDWKLQRRIIRFGVFGSSPTSLERMIRFKEAYALDSDSGPSNVIQEAIKDWNLDQKHFSLTLVSEIRNDERTSKLMDLFIQRKCLPVRGELYNIACVDDVLNTIVSKGEPMLHVVAGILEKFIQQQMSSSLTRRQLLEVVSHMGLKCPQEDAKWWHKIYFRLEVFLHFKKAFPSEELLSGEDAKTVDSVCKILRTFHRAVEVISGPVRPTSNIYFNELWKVRTTLQEEASTDHTELANMVCEMQETFNEYWQNSYVWLSIPVVLDPRFKITFIEFRLKRAFGSDADKYLSAIRDTIRELFHEYCGPVDKPGVDASNHEARDVELDGFDSDSLEDWDEHLNAQTRSQLLTELDNYLEDGLVPRKDDFDILNWWMSNSTKYPTLSIMARDFLAMPASAVHSEAALSSEGPVIHKQWSTLDIKTVEALVCTRDWIK